MSATASPAPTVIPVNELVVHKTHRLGGVRTANVFRGTLHDKVVAVKLLSSSVLHEDLSSRAYVWQQLHHPRIHQLFGISNNDADPLYIVTECHLKGNIRQFLTKQPHVDRPSLVLQIAHGMQYLHSRGVVHGGLKPSNLLVKDDGEICISDYGMIELQSSTSSDSHRYYSPEAWKGVTSPPSDVFAFAMGALEIFTSTAPWGNLSEKHVYQQVVTENNRPDRPPDDLCSRVGLCDRIWSIIEEAWGKDPRLRPTFDIIVRLWQIIVPEENWRGVQAESRPSHMSARSSSSSVPPAYQETEEDPYDRGPIPLSSAPSASPSLSSSSAGSRTPSRSQASRTPTSPFIQPRSPLATPSSVRATFSPAQSPQLSAHRLPPSSPGYPNVLSAPRPLTPRSSSNRSISRLPSIAPSISSSSSGGSASSSGSPQSPPPQTPPSAGYNIANVGVHTPSTPNSPSWGSGPRTPSVRRYTATFVKPVDTDTLASLQQGEQFSRAGTALPPLHEHEDSTISREESIRNWEASHRRYTIQRNAPMPDAMSIRTDSNSGAGSISDRSNPVLLVGALRAEIKAGSNRTAQDIHLAKIQWLAAQSSKEAQRLITAGAVPDLIHLLQTRAPHADGLEVVLITLGHLAHDSISANTIYRTKTSSTLVEIFASSESPEVMTLTIWCLNRITRSPEIASGLLKQNLLKHLLQKGLRGSHATPALSAYCIGTLAQSDPLAETMAELAAIATTVAFLRRVTESSNASHEDVCGGLYAIARLSRSIKLAKALIKAGVVPLLARHLNEADDPEVLHWACRAVGCLMRPSAGDISKVLLEGGIARALARVPTVITPEDADPLASFAFAIQRFSCAEWGSSTRKALVDAGVVDSLLAALRTAADEPYPHVHIELALAVSFLGDVGGSALRKEITRAGGVDILKRVGAEGTPDVAKACSIAVTSITGNIWSRNAASAKTAMSHNWSGGCPEYQPTCPLVLTNEDDYPSD